MRLIKIFVILSALSLSSCGIFSGFEPPEILKHPDAPMLILERRGGYLRVAIYDKQGNGMVPYGWVEAPEGWTLHKFDWEKHIQSRTDN